MSEIEVLTEFKTQLISFFDELIGQFPLEGDLVVVRLFFANQIPIQDVMNNFNHKINTNDQELRKMIKNRNEAFFLENNMFENLGKDKINHIKKITISNKPMPTFSHSAKCINAEEEGCSTSMDKS